jgi:hypothetical protein
MPYTPSAEEIRFLIKRHWQKHADLSTRAYAHDREFLDLTVQATEQLMKRLSHNGALPLDAEVRALRQITFAD